MSNHLATAFLRGWEVVRFFIGAARFKGVNLAPKEKVPPNGGGYSSF